MNLWLYYVIIHLKESEDMGFLDKLFKRKKASDVSKSVDQDTPKHSTYDQGQADEPKPEVEKESFEKGLTEESKKETPQADSFSKGQKETPSKAASEPTFDKGQAAAQIIGDYVVEQNKNTKSPHFNEWGVRKRESKKVIKYFSNEKEAKKHAENLSSS